MKVSIIAAMARNRVIGAQQEIPWHLPADLRHFKQTTSGHTLVMGRLTFETLTGPLPQRRILVLTSHAIDTSFGAQAVASLPQAIELARAAGETELFIAGGGGVYAAGLEHADRMYLTFVDVEVEGDAVFPQVDFDRWREVSREQFGADESHAHSFSICLFERLDDGHRAAQT